MFSFAQPRGPADGLVGLRSRLGAREPHGPPGTRGGSGAEVLGESVSECCSCFRALRRVFSRALVLDLGLHPFRWMCRGSYGRDLWSLWPQVAGAGLDLIVSPGRLFFFLGEGGGGEK